MAAVEFFFDPLCPWAWITSRWVVEVQRQRPIDLEWRFIALRFVNEERPMSAERLAAQDMSLGLLRVAAALREQHGCEAVGPYYTAVGGAIHVDRQAAGFIDGTALPAIVAELGHDPGLASAVDDPAWDKAVRADTEDALGRTGRDLGTPIITFGAPDGPSFFGPVISRVPRGARAVELWDSVEKLARFPGFAELKRSVRERPQVER